MPMVRGLVAKSGIAWGVETEKRTVICRRQTNLIKFKAISVQKRTYARDNLLACLSAS